MARTARPSHCTVTAASNFRLTCATLVAVAAGVLSASAQSVVEPPPPPPDASVLTPGASGEVFNTPQVAPIQWGDVGVRPHVFYRLTRGDGVQFRPGQQEKTTIQSFSPGVTFDYGSRWTADYTPTWRFYSNSAFQDTVAHHASVKGTAGFTDGQLIFSEQYERSNNPRIETGRQTKEESSNTSLGASYALGSHSRIEANVGYSLRFVDISPDSREWTTSEWLHYQFTNRLNAGVGVGLGYASIDPGADMSYVQELAHVGWHPVDKIMVDVHGGFEQRKFHKAGAAKLNNPNYGAGVTYQPIETTTLSFSADRAVATSYFRSEATERTSWNFAVGQRLLQHFQLSGTIGQHKSRYIPAAAVLVTTRNDRATTSSLRLGTSFLRRGSIAIVYLHTHNTSSATGFTFTSDQMGLEVGYSF
jgi:hypothetical protein